jgi:CheY-like chemotaxis protein
MPKLNGFDVLNNFQQDENLKKLPVIVFTTSSNPADIQKCYDTGANAYVVKPFDFTDLEKSISAISNFWGDVNVKPMFT